MKSDFHSFCCMVGFWGTAADDAVQALLAIDADDSARWDVLASGRFGGVEEATPNARHARAWTAPDGSALVLYRYSETDVAIDYWQEW